MPLSHIRGVKAVQRDPRKARVDMTRKGTCWQMYKKGLSLKGLVLILCLFLIPLLTGFELLGLLRTRGIRR